MDDRARRVLSRHLTPPTPPDPNSADPDELAAWIEAEDMYLFARAVSELGERDQVLAVLHYFEDLSVDDIAAALGRPRDTVLSGLYHARSDLMRNPEWADRMSQLQEFWRRTKSFRASRAGEP